ncbi:hypothetical protein BU26DRAFT_508682 [Trematosphaeria pertusa]|uniref:Amidoligase enzyme n=1 Tax=Trematosphaeria pertusa TaxID=390896 RepID=A0A6A6I3D4_9PLEO|nr:uncharacterized protein BU26DRAFT_508682 [Trematosphaeria pertusa]KAF2244679.1 hypothetical protein BU26DRAFT_508682 [Trematosphaeria pertusa]
MATLIQNGVQIAFGIELELLLQAKDKRLSDLKRLGYVDNDKEHRSELGRGMNQQAIEKYIQQRLDAVQLPSQQRRNKMAQKDYSLWGIEKDESITKKKIGCYGVELVSPVLFHGWPNTLEQVIDIIKDAFTIVEDASTGTHVHIAPLGRPWSDAEFKQLSKGIVAWSTLLEPLMPRPSRNCYARWNHEQWPDRKQQENIIMSIDRLSRDEIKHKISLDRRYAWNLYPTDTIEFRRPYQTLSHKEALHWVVLTLSLVSFFLRNGELQVPQQNDIKAAREKIRKESNKLGLALHLNFSFCK